MIALLQRVRQASVTVDGRQIAAIGPGMMTLVCAQRGDTLEHASALADRLVRYRVFGDDSGRMNRSLHDRQAAGEPAGLLLVPQFTLAADTRSGLRPGFSLAAPPGEAQSLFEAFVGFVRAHVVDTQTGRFGADMQVALVNDGPVTFWLEIPAANAPTIAEPSR